MLLRRTLFVNGISTAALGLLALLAAPLLARLLGLHSPAVLIVVGAGLVAFAALLLAQARRPRIEARLVWAIAVVDLAWVIGSVVVVEIGVLTALGNWLVAAVGAVVLLFAVLEFRGAASLGDA